MTRMIGPGVFEYSNSPADRNDDSAQEPDYSDKWQRFGPDMLWPRSNFIGASVGMGSYMCELSNGLENWDWLEFLYAEGKVGQRRDGIAGITRDSTGAALAGVTVKGFDLATDLIVDTTVSDASGNFVVTTPFTGQTMYCIAYLAGTPVFGATAHLTPS